VELDPAGFAQEHGDGSRHDAGSPSVARQGRTFATWRASCWRR